MCPISIFPCEELFTEQPIGCLVSRIRKCTQCKGSQYYVNLYQSVAIVLVMLLVSIVADGRERWTRYSLRKQEQTCQARRCTRTDKRKSRDSIIVTRGNDGRAPVEGQSCRLAIDSLQTCILPLSHRVRIRYANIKKRAALKHLYSLIYYCDTQLPIGIKPTNIVQIDPIAYMRNLGPTHDHHAY